MVNYKQVIIAQIGKTTEVPFFTPAEGLIWSRNYYLDTADQAASFWNTAFGATFDDSNTGADVISVNTVSWEGQQLARYDTLAELSNTLVQDAFHFDYDAQVLYVKNFNNHPCWQTDGTSAGIVIGYSSMPDVLPGKRPFNTAYFGQEHEPRLIASSVNDTQELEDWQLNQMVFKNIKLSLINSDGALDDLRNQILNQRLDLLLADVPSTQEIESLDFNVVSTGVVTDVSFPDEDTISITASDRRKAWEDTIPNLKYAEGFGGLVAGDDAVNKTMQMVIGTAYKVPCVTLDEANGKYHVGMASGDDPLDSVSAVYTFDAGSYTSVSFTADLSTGIITLTTPADADNGDICADVVGITAPSISGGSGENTPLDIAIYLIANYGSMPYVESLWNRTKINAIRNARNFPAGIFIPIEGETLSDVVERCTFSINTVFFQSGSKISAATITANETPAATIYADQLATMPGISYGTDDYMSRISVGYHQDCNQDIFRVVADDTHEADAVKAYQYKVEYEFDTILKDITYASVVGAERYDLAWQILADLDMSLESPIDFDYLDTVEFNYLMNGRQMLPNALYRVTGLSKINRTAKLEYIEEIT